MRLRVAVVDDQPLFRLAARYVLADLLSDGTVIEFDNPAQLGLTKLRKEKVDLVLLGVNEADLAPITELGRVHRLMPELSSVVVAAQAHPRLAACAKEVGSSGFVSKSSPAPVLRSAVKTAMSGGRWFKAEASTPVPRGVDATLQMADLTPKQKKVLELVAKGMSNRQIGSIMGTAENTVKCHVVAILSKLECRSRTQAALLMNAAGSGGITGHL